MTCSLLYSASVPNSVDLYDFQFETCFSMFQTVLMMMMTVMTMTVKRVWISPPLCLDMFETVHERWRVVVWIRFTLILFVEEEEVVEVEVSFSLLFLDLIIS